MRSRSLASLYAALPQPLVPFVRELVDATASAGARVHLVGGPVRDWLLGREVRDVDLLIEGARDVAAVERCVRKATRGVSGVRITAHARFATFAIEGLGAPVDVTTARRERYAHPGALPEVEPGDLEEDLWRRDFSVNAIAAPLDGSANQAVPLADPCGGIEDLNGATLRVLHARSFHDDPTRALRAARLGERLGFRLARGSHARLHAALRDGACGAVSGDRWRRELEKLFGDASLGLDPADALRKLDGWHVLPAIEPGLAFPREALWPVRRLGRTLAQPRWEAGRMRPFAAGLFVWFASLPAPLRRRSLRRFSVRGELADRTLEFAKRRPRWQTSLARAKGRGAVDALLGELKPDEVHALHAYCETTSRRRIERWAVEDRARKTPVGGSDLLALGLEGPRVGEVLAELRRATLDARVRSRDEALALAEEIARRLRRSDASKASRRTGRTVKAKPKTKAAASTAKSGAARSGKSGSRRGSRPKQ